MKYPRENLFVFGNDCWYIYLLVLFGSAWYALVSMGKYDLDVFGLGMASKLDKSCLW